MTIEHVTYCLAYARNKPGRRCGNPDVEDGELIMCRKHSRQTRERLHLAERVEYGGHLVARDWRANNGDLRDDWYFYCADHTQIATPRHSMLERHIREEIDACNAERLAGCSVYVPAPRSDEINWDRFKLSRSEIGHE